MYPIPHDSCLIHTPLTRLRFGSADFPGLVNGSDKENKKLTFSFLMHMSGDAFQAIMVVLISHSLCAHVFAHTCTHLCHTTPCWEKCRITMLNVQDGAWTFPSLITSIIIPRHGLPSMGCVFITSVAREAWRVRRTVICLCVKSYVA